MTEVIDVGVRGRQIARPALTLCGVTVVSAGRFPTVGEIFDEYWLQRSSLPRPEDLIGSLMKREDRPDIFTFTQRVPEAAVLHPYRFELENFAVLPIDTYERWFEKQIPAAARRNVRAAEKRGICVRLCEFDERYVNGIMAIYNETPVRAGRRFWHYGKKFELVARENGTYADRSIFLAAYRGEEMVGYLKVVCDKETAAIMQVLSKLAYRDARPNNALIAEAVRQCASRGIGYLLYEKYDYGKKRGDSLTKFKETNGFRRFEVPRYYVPLTRKGRVALSLGLHKRLVERLPERLVAPMRKLRARWYERSAEAA